MEYPKYYRKNGRCLKVLSEKEALKITLPPDYVVALRTIITGADRVQEELHDFEEATATLWEDFSATFRAQILEEKRIKNQVRQQEFEAGKLGL
jgi:hypothetical protein